MEQIPKDYLDNIKKRMKRSGLTGSKHLDNAFSNVPRVYFVEEKYRDLAYIDKPLSIPDNQTISAPHMYAIMLSHELANPKKNQKILEIGTGSGFGAALISKIVYPEIVHTIERHGKLVEFAKRNLRRSACNNVNVVHGNGTKDIPEMSFDCIIVTAAGKELPGIYLEKLKIGGCIIIPLENKKREQWIWKIIKQETGEPKYIRSMQVVFVPLVYS